METLRRVLIGTPCLSGTVDAWYADSLFDSIKIGLASGVNLIPSLLLSESILPMARNELIHSALIHEVESLVFIDSDQQWAPQALLDVVNSPYDVYGLPVVSKTEEYGKFNIKLHDPAGAERDADGNIRVDGVGTGFLKLSRKAIVALCESSRVLEFRGKHLPMVCEYGEVGDAFVSEDFLLCRKLTELGFGVWVGTSHTVSHRGTKTWHGDFAEFLNGLSG